MKLLVKVIEAEYSDAAQIAIVDMTWEFLVNARILVNEAELISYELKSPVSLRIDNNAGEYFMVRQQDLPSLVQAEGRIADFDEFNLSSSVITRKLTSGARGVPECVPFGGATRLCREWSRQTPRSTKFTTFSDC